MPTLPEGTQWPFLLPIAGLATLTVIIGFFPEPFLQFAERAAAQLLNPDAYVAAVLGAGA